MSTNRRDPLDAEERDLARVVRALPAGEPPSALDERILAMARDAVVGQPALKDEGSPPRSFRRHRRAWAFGTAATMVLAAGLVWRLGGPEPEALEAAAGKPTALEHDVLGSAASKQIAPAEPALDVADVASPPPEPARAERARAEPEIQRVATPMYAVAPGTIVDSVPPPPVMADNATSDVDAVFTLVRRQWGRGDDAAARKTLKAFLAEHPDTVVPPDLAILVDRDERK